jgi:deazaflavin-dependent oxidoreductase (nitroreductase family)
MHGLLWPPTAGSAHHPNWYHNLKAHPDQVWIEVAGRSAQATAEQLEGPRRDEAWRRITTTYPRFAGYEKKTDRTLPVLRLTAVAS